MTLLILTAKKLKDYTVILNPLKTFINKLGFLRNDIMGIAGYLYTGYCIEIIDLKTSKSLLVSKPENHNPKPSFIIHHL